MRSFILCLALAFHTLAAHADNPPAGLFSTPLTTLAGKSETLSKYKGKPLLINFWARWCAPCRKEIPWLQAASDQYQGKILVIGIGLEDDPRLATQFARENKMRYPAYIAAEQAIPLMKALGNTMGGLPFTVAVDRDGQVIDSHMGIMQPDRIEAAIAKLRP